MVTCHRLPGRVTSTLVVAIAMVSPENLARAVEDFLTGAATAVVLENGVVAFDMAQSKYTISGECNRCLLHIWSAERNVVRRVVDAEMKNGALRLAVQRLGQAKASKLEICRERDRRSASARRSARASYEQKLRRMLERHFPDFKIAQLTGSVDLEKSFGPVYTRGLVRQGRTAFAVLGVNASETQASIDATLTFAILWLDVCRSKQAANVLVEGLKLFVPAGRSALVRERMANLNRDAAKWSLYELNERDDALVKIDCADRGNVATRLVRATDEEAARTRFTESIARVRQILPNCEVALVSPAEIGFRWRGLEFARARLGCIPGSFCRTEEIVYGVGAEERVLETRNEAAFVALAHSLRDVRHPYGPRQHPLWRLRPER